jgi:hypothetical protein
MKIHKDKQQENFTLVVTRNELSEIKDALGVRCMYLDALLRKKIKIGKSKDVPQEHEKQNDARNMYIQITKELEFVNL